MATVLETALTSTKAEIGSGAYFLDPASFKPLQIYRSWNYGKNERDGIQSKSSNLPCGEICDLAVEN